MGRGCFGANEPTGVEALAIDRLKPKNDFVFGRLFGEKESKDSLISLLNAILRKNGQEAIADLKIIENKQLRKMILDEKTGSLDIRAELASGEQVNIEMQMVNRYNMVRRTLFYMAKLYASSIKSGEDYAKLKKTIAINLLDFEQFKFERFHSTFHFYEDHENRAMLTDALEVHFIEFPKFERAAKDKRDPLHRWLMFLDEKLPEEELKELMAMDPMIEKTEEKLELLSGDESVRELAEARARALSDWNSSMNGSREEGRAEGKAEVAFRLLQKGMDVEFAAEMTGLSVDEVRRIAAEKSRTSDPL
jgi:predicted transposase/invertase (TIGR01784 family)